MREPIAEIFIAAEMLSVAANAHKAGLTDLAHSLIAIADLPVIRDWTESVWGRQNAAVHSFRTLPDSPPRLTSNAGRGPRMPTTSVKREVIARDGYHCRFCGIPVIGPEARASLIRDYAAAVPWGAKNSEQHAAVQCLWLQFDHVLPFTRGGDSSPANLVVTCAPCNFGRMEWTLDEAGLIDPRTTAPTKSWSGYANWNGLYAFGK